MKLPKKDYVIITAPGKSVSDIKSSIMSSLSSMYTNPSKVISTLGVLTRNSATEKYIDTYTLYEELTKAGEQYQAKAEEIFNPHISKIVSGLSSNPDW